MEDDEEDLQKVDMQDILNRASKYLPADFVVIELGVHVPALNFSMTNEFGQALLLARIENFDIQIQKAAKAFFNASLTLEDFCVRDYWSTLSEKGFPDAKYKYLAQTADPEGEDPVSDPNEKARAVSIFYELKAVSKITAKFKRKLHLYALIPLLIEVQRTMGKALGAGQKMDFQFYQRAAGRRFRNFKDQAR